MQTFGRPTRVVKYKFRRRYEKILPVNNCHPLRRIKILSQSQERSDGGIKKSYLLITVIPCGGYLSPEATPSGTIESISFSSSCESSISAAAAFS